MTGLQLKIAQGQALDASWYGIKTKIGSIILPEKQEKRLYAKVDTALADVRQLQKTMVGVGAGLGAGALATIALAGAILWTRWQGERSHESGVGSSESSGNPGHNPGGPYPPMTAEEKARAAVTVPEEIEAWKQGRWGSRQQAIAVGLSRARTG